jgi:Integrase zinc binding domain/Chromo (CHRromatin Organisation MOdifier) domain
MQSDKVVCVFDYGHSLTPHWLMDSIEEWVALFWKDKHLSQFDPFPYQVYNFSAFEADWKQRIEKAGEEIEKVYMFINPPHTRLQETIEKISTEKIQCVMLIHREAECAVPTMFTREQSLEIYGIDLKLVVIEKRKQEEELPLMKVKTTLTETEIQLAWKMLKQDKDLDVELWEKKQCPKHLLFIPKEEREKLLFDKHRSALAMHGTVRQTLESLVDNYWWTTLEEDVISYIKSCDICQMARPHKVEKGDVLPYPINEPYKRIHMDILTMDEDEEGYRYILNITDSATKLTKGGAMKNKTEMDCAKVFAECWILQEPGVPGTIVTDADGAFVAGMFGQLYKMYGVKHFTTSPYHSQANGQVEVRHKIMREKVRFLLTEEKLPLTEWRKYLTLIYDKINRTNGNLGKSAYSLTTGHSRKSIAGEKRELEQTKDGYDWYKDLIKNRHEAMKKDVKNRGNNQLKINTKKLMKGDLIIIKKNTRSKNDLIFDGPFVIHKVERGVTVHYYKENDSGNVLKRHISEIVRYYGNSNNPIDKAYEVQEIVDHKRNGRSTLYLVRWKNFDSSYDSWLSQAQLNHAKKLLEQYKAK